MSNPNRIMIGLVSLALTLLASCTLGVPEVAVTPTIAPSATVTLGPTRVIVEPTDVPLPTALPSDTASPDPSATVTPLPSSTPTATDEPPTQTPLPTLTGTATQTATATNTDSPTVTELPTLVPTKTATPLPSDTVSPTFVPIAPPTQTPRVIPPTATRTLSPEELQRFTQEAEPIFVTPTIITIEAPTDFPNFVTFTPLPGATQVPPLPDAVTATATFQPTVDIRGITIPPTLASFPTQPVIQQPVAQNQQIPQLAPGTPTAAVTFAAPLPRATPSQITTSGLLDFTIGTNGGAPVNQSTVNTGGIGDVYLYAQNPANPDEFAVVNNTGLLFMGENGPANALQTGHPFTEYHYQTQSRADNNSPITDMEWSGDGVLAFIVKGDKINSDGVWMVKNQSPIQVFRDCPFEGHPGCLTTLSGGRNTYRWVTREIKWAPLASSKMILVLDLLDEGRRGFVIQPTWMYSITRMPPLHRYETANWSADGTRVIVSGRGPDDRYIIGSLNPDNGAVDLIFDGSARGLYPRDAIEQAGGRILAFAATSPGGVVRLIDGNGNAISGAVGSAPPRKIDWNGLHNTALVETTDGRSFVVSANGSVTSAANMPQQGGRAGAQVVGSPGSGGGGAAAAAPVPVRIPSGVIAGSAYNAGQQLRVLNEAGLNVRSAPSISGQRLTTMNRGDYIVVLAGPVNDGTYTWWQVQNAAGVRGWVAGTIEGIATIAP